MNIATVLLAMQTIREYKAQAAGDLSKALGFAVGYVALVEEGRKKVSLDYLIKFANYSRMDVADILNMATALENETQVKGVTNSHMEEKINHMVNWALTRKAMDELEAEDDEDDEEIEVSESSEPDPPTPELSTEPEPTKMFSAG